MAGKDAAEQVMEPGRLKPLLMLSKREPVNCAVALTKDKDGVILLDKKRKPRGVAADLKKRAAAASITLDAPTVRFGRAEVDTEADPGLVKLVVNKEASAVMRPKLLVYLKRSGFQRCEIIVDEALEQEADDGEAVEGTAPGGPPASNGAAPPGGLAAATALAARGAAPGAPPPVIDRTKTAWTLARGRVDSELKKLLDAMKAVYKDQEFGTAVDRVFQAKVGPMLAGLDNTLVDTLDQAAKATDGAQRKVLLEQARGIIGRYERYVAGQPLIAQLDANPFVPLQIGKTLTGTLTVLNKSVAAAG